MSMTWMGDPLERASSAAEPAVEPTSMALARRASLALFDPADLTQLTAIPCGASADSSQPWFLMTRLSGLYVAKSMLSVPPWVATPGDWLAAGDWARPGALARSREAARAPPRSVPVRRWSMVVFLSDV